VSRLSRGLPAVASAKAGDLLLATVIAVAGYWLGLGILGDYRASGGIPFLQQNAFGPAVLTACGRGYQNPDDPAVPALQEFLTSRRHHFDCGDLPESIPTLPLRPFHRVTMYMELVVAAIWKTGPIAWSSIDRLNAAAFGLDLALLFLLCRAVAGRVPSIAAAVAWAVSPLHLTMAMDLRDYVKAPFILGAATLIAWMLRSTSPRRAWLGAAAAAVAAIGSGFRTDVLLVLVPVVAAVALAGADHVRARLVSAAGAVALFAIVAFPILRGYTGGGVISHVLLLGLTSPFDTRLQLETPMYRVGPVYSDGYIFSLVWDRMYRAEGEARARAMTFGSAEYDAATTAYFRTVVERLPADLLLRTLTAGRRSITVMFEPPYDAPMPWLRSAAMRSAIAARAAMLPALLLLLPIALIVAWIAAVRPGWRNAAAIAVLTLTFPAASALQFHERHVFYLEVIALAALVVTASELYRFVRHRERRDTARRAIGALAGLAAVAAFIGVSYATASAVQSRQLTSLFDAYERLPATALKWSVEPLPNDRQRLTPLSAAASGITAPFHVIEFDRARCGVSLFRFVMRYRSPAPADDVSFDGWVTLIDAPRLHLYSPVVAIPRLGVEFAGLELPARGASCISTWTVAEVPPQLPKFVAQLPEDWRTLPLRQRMRREGGGIARRDGSSLYLSDTTSAVDAAAFASSVSGVLERIGDVRPNGYLLRAPERPADEGDTFVLEGTAENGGFVVGLQEGGVWGPMVSVTRPGRFLVVLRPPSAGTYSVVVADGGRGGDHGIALTRAGWLPQIR
jgi:hypothetical protein